MAAGKCSKVKLFFLCFLNSFCDKWYPSPNLVQAPEGYVENMEVVTSRLIICAYLWIESPGFEHWLGTRCLMCFWAKHFTLPCLSPSTFTNGYR